MVTVPHYACRSSPTLIYKFECDRSGLQPLVLFRQIHAYKKRNLGKPMFATDPHVARWCPALGPQIGPFIRAAAKAAVRVEAFGQRMPFASLSPSVTQ